MHVFLILNTHIAILASFFDVCAITDDLFSYIVLVYPIFSWLQIVFTIKIIKESNFIELLHQSFNTSRFLLLNLQQILRNSLMVLQLSELRILHCMIPLSSDLIHFRLCSQIFPINLNGISQHNPYLIIHKFAQINLDQSLLSIYFSIFSFVHLSNLTNESKPRKNQSRHFKSIIIPGHPDSM